MKPPTSSEAPWRNLCESLRCGQPRARLRLLATVSSFVGYAGQSLAPETRAEVSERIAASLAARIRAAGLRSPEELLSALDAELAHYVARDPHDGVLPSRALLGRLATSLSALPEAQQRALLAYYGPASECGALDSGLRHQALATLRERLRLEAPR